MPEVSQFAKLLERAAKVDKKTKINSLQNLLQHKVHWQMKEIDGLQHKVRQMIRERAAIEFKSNQRKIEH